MPIFSKRWMGQKGFGGGWGPKKVGLRPKKIPGPNGKVEDIRRGGTSKRGGFSLMNSEKPKEKIKDQRNNEDWSEWRQRNPYMGRTLSTSVLFYLLEEGRKVWAF